MPGLGFWTGPRPGPGPGQRAKPVFVLELKLASVACFGVVVEPEISDRFGR